MAPAQKSAAERWKRVTVVAGVAGLGKGAEQNRSQVTSQAQAKSAGQSTGTTPARPFPPVDDPHFQELGKKFSDRVRDGKRGTRLEGDLRSFVKDIQVSLRAESTRDENRDRALVQHVRRACEATIEKCFYEHATVQIELDKVKTEYDQMQTQNRKTQRKRVVENVGSRDQIRKPDANESHMTTEELDEYPDLHPLQSDARELCEISINERVRQILEKPNKVLLNAINKFLETEDMPAIWMRALPEEKEKKTLQSPRAMEAMLRPPRPLAQFNTQERQRIQELQKQIQDMEAELVKTREETKSLNEEKDELTMEIEALQKIIEEELQTLRDQLKLARGDMHDKILWLEKQVAEEKSKEANKEIERLRKQVKMLEKDIEQTKERETKCHLQGEALKEKIPNVQAELEKMEEILVQRRSQMKVLMEEREQVKEKITELNEDSKKVEDTLEELVQMQKAGLRFDENGEVYSLKPIPVKRSSVKGPDGRSSIQSYLEDMSGKEPSEAELARLEARRQRELEREKRLRAQKKLLKNLIKVLESQGRLCTPDGNLKQWGAPLNSNARLGPAGSAAHRVIQLLSEAETEGILDSASNDDEPRSAAPNALSMKRNVHNAMKGRMKHAEKRHFPGATSQSFYVLAPDDDLPPQQMRMSQSCTDFGSSKRKEAMGLTW